jgi:hypothetical protein
LAALSTVPHGRRRTGPTNFRLVPESLNQFVISSSPYSGAFIYIYIYIYIYAVALLVEALCYRKVMGSRLDEVNNLFFSLPDPFSHTRLDE